MISIPVLSALVASTSGRDTPAAPVATLEWNVAPPTTAAVEANVTASWKGGAYPYTCTIIQGVIEENRMILNEGDPLRMTMNIDGTNQPAGDWVWTIESADGQTLTATVMVS